MSLDDESTTAHPKPRYQLQSNTQSFEPISLSSRSSRQYHQASTVPLSSSITPIRNFGLSYTTSTVHQSPFGGVNQWCTPIDAPTFTPSPYMSFQVVATPLWPSVGVKPNTWKSGRLGVFRDSRMFRSRQQGVKHLALRCSWCHWKGLETQISKMPSHWQFAHLQPKLWAKEGPGVKLVV